MFVRKRQLPEGQASLFSEVEPRPSRKTTAAVNVDGAAARKWQMPPAQGRTVAEIRLRWLKRLTPAQVARVEAELSRLPQTLGKLGFGAVQVERVFVRRRRT